jgi:HD-GYP domain-containing protein (c-di-GMP phosphodiesterase class II)
MVREVQSTANGRHTSASAQASALGVVLQEEFGVSFTFYDAASGQPLRRSSANVSAWFSTACDVNVIHDLVGDGRARVTPLSGGRYQVALVLHDSNRAQLVAVGELTAVNSGDNAGERQRLQRWAQSVADRLRLADELLLCREQAEVQSNRVKAAWETILSLDHLVRRLRIHKDPQKNRQRVLETAFQALGVQALVWAPKQHEESIFVQGDTKLASADWRRLSDLLTHSPDRQPHGPFLCNQIANQSWGASFPSITSLLAFPVADQNVVGWVIAVNKQAPGGGQRGVGRKRLSTADATGTSPAAKEDSAQPPSSMNGTLPAPFGHSDAALLTPFVGLLEMHQRGSSRYQDLRELLVGLTRSLTSALDAKDAYTFGHSERVARIALELGRELQLSEDDLGDIYLAGLLHDVGKIGIHDAVLSKPGPLTPEEFEHVKQHVTIGYKILADLRPIRNLLPGVLYHHEHFDGTGYPDGLAGEAIPLLARILAVADGYDAMSTARPYRDAMPCRKVEEILKEGADTQWDRSVVEAFQRCRHKIHAIRQRGVGESLYQALDGALRMEQSSTKISAEIAPVT